MSVKPIENNTGPNKWDRLYQVLSSQPRRALILALLNESGDKWLSLSEVRDSYIHSMDPEKSEIRLRHHHLPMLAEAGYVTWESDPFRFKRGPNFEEPAFVVRKMVKSKHEYPEGLRAECIFIGRIGE